MVDTCSRRLRHAGKCACFAQGGGSQDDSISSIRSACHGRRSQRPLATSHVPDASQSGCRAFQGIRAGGRCTPKPPRPRKRTCEPSAALFPPVRHCCDMEPSARVAQTMRARAMRTFPINIFCRGCPDTHCVYSFLNQAPPAATPPGRSHPRLLDSVDLGNAGSIRRSNSEGTWSRSV